MKTIKSKTAFIVYSLNALVWYGFGISYLFANEITSYHKQAIGVDWAGLAPGVKTLLLVLMKGTGDAVLVGAISFTFLLLIPFRKGDKWVKWALLCIGMAIWIPMLIGSIWIYTATGAPSPWQLNLVMLVLLLVAFILSW
ncbi:MAG: hypothetical protein ABSA18_07715 [Dehalococcoidia bacterium]|jgi:hypothetical protein